MHSLSEKRWLSSIWQFSRPHTIIGTSLSVFSLFSIAVFNTGSIIDNASVIPLLMAWFACLLGNIYIVGLNQIFDVAIDRVNKPHLPIASGAFSLQEGYWIVGISGFLAVFLAVLSGHWLLFTVVVSLLIGTAYSSPPIRLKRYPFLAALCILVVRGLIVNLGLFLHFTKVLGGEALLTTSVWALSLFILFFTVAIAIFKDVPDMEGDRKYQIKTFTLLLGKSTIFNLSRWVISGCYLGMIIAAFLSLLTVNPLTLIVSHVVLLLLLWWRSLSVNLDSKKSIVDFYQFIWKLFFLEYIIFPLTHFT